MGVGAVDVGVCLLCSCVLVMQCVVSDRYCVCSPTTLFVIQLTKDLAVKEALVTQVGCLIVFVCVLCGCVYVCMCGVRDSVGV